MRRKIINSQITNFKTYRMYLRQMLTLAENVFKFTDLPEDIDVAFLNKTLLRSGSVAFFKDEVLGVIALPYRTIGTLDVYGRPKRIEVYSHTNNYKRVLDKNDYVIMYDNNGRYPLYLDICQIAERIALSVRTTDINIIHQRTPRVWKTSKDKELSLKNMINDIDAMVENVATYDSIDIDDMGAVLAPAPYITGDVDTHLDKLWAEFFRLIGVANLQEQKRERMILDEMSASQGGTIASRFSRFQPREEALIKINKKFGTNIEVEYYDGEPTTKEEGVEDVSELSSLSTSGEGLPSLGLGQTRTSDSVRSS